MLPIQDFEEQIVAIIKNNQVTIITAETGAGKSTQVPQFLVGRGYNVVVTEPRRLAARSLAQRVAEEMGVQLGGLVGYRVGDGRCDSDQTKCLFCTDGLELVREIHSDWKPDVLIVDEVHEWNINTETLLAWAKKRLVHEPDFRLVIMSATVDSRSLSDFFFGAPVIEVPGRLYSVEERPRRFSVEDEVADLVRQGRNVLVFQPGKPEIAKMINELRELQLDAVFLPLHAELESQEQDRIFGSYSKPKVIVATNVAQTSITVPDIDAVVDTGVEKRIETIDGIEMLRLGRISCMDAIQRQGRAGRCRPGIYIECYDGDEEKPEFPVAEIQRVRLDQLVLRLAIQGFDAADLEFFHQPDHKAIVEAKRCLESLDAMKNGQVTPIGRQMAKLPINVKYARMIVEAQNLDVVGDVLTIAACLEVKGICDRQDRLCQWQKFSRQRESDLLVQLDVFNAAAQIQKDKLRDNGINPKAYFKALEIRKKLVEALLNSAQHNRRWVNLMSSDDRHRVIMACVSGMVDHLYSVDCRNFCHNGDETFRRLNMNSVVAAAKYLVGLPLDIEIKNRWGETSTINLVTMATRVTPEMMRQVAPHRFSLEYSNWQLSPEGNISFDVVERFNGISIGGRCNQEMTWPEIEVEFPYRLEEIAKEVIDLQFKSASRSGICKSIPIIDIGSVPRHPLKSVCYGHHPATMKDLIAYPALVEEDWLIGRRYLIQFFQTKAEAEERSIESNEVRDGTIAKLAEAKIEVGELEVKAGWTHLGGREYRCPKGHSARAGKNASTVKCNFCDSILELKREQKISEPVSVSTPTEKDWEKVHGGWQCPNGHLVLGNNDLQAWVRCDKCLSRKPLTLKVK